MYHVMEIDNVILAIVMKLLTVLQNLLSLPQTLHLRLLQLLHQTIQGLLLNLYLLGGLSLSLLLVVY